MGYGSFAKFPHSIIIAIITIMLLFVKYFFRTRTRAENRGYFWLYKGKKFVFFNSTLKFWQKPKIG